MGFVAVIVGFHVARRSLCAHRPQHPSQRVRCHVHNVAADAQIPLRAALAVLLIFAAGNLLPVVQTGATPPRHIVVGVILGVVRGLLRGARTCLSLSPSKKLHRYRDKVALAFVLEFVSALSLSFRIVPSPRSTTNITASISDVREAGTNGLICGVAIVIRRHGAPSLSGGALTSSPRQKMMEGVTLPILPRLVLISYVN